MPQPTDNFIPNRALIQALSYNANPPSHCEFDAATLLLKGIVPGTGITISQDTDGRLTINAVGMPSDPNYDGVNASYWTGCANHPAETIGQIVDASVLTSNTFGAYTDDMREATLTGWWQLCANIVTAYTTVFGSHFSIQRWKRVS